MTREDWQKKEPVIVDLIDSEAVLYFVDATGAKSEGDMDWIRKDVVAYAEENDNWLGQCGSSFDDSELDYLRAGYRNVVLQERYYSYLSVLSGYSVQVLLEVANRIASYIRL